MSQPDTKQFQTIQQPQASKQQSTLFNITVPGGFQDCKDEESNIEKPLTNLSFEVVIHKQNDYQQALSNRDASFDKEQFEQTPDGIKRKQKF